MRLFIAISILEKLQQRLHAFAQTVLGEISAPAKFRIVPPENIHLTLHFAGECDDHAQQAIEEAIRETVGNVSPWKMRITGAGTFGKRKKPTVLWAGIDDPACRAAECRQVLCQALQKRGMPVESRPFKPHLTLARIRHIQQAHELTSAVQSATNCLSGEMEVQALKLFRSQLTPHGANYTVLQECLLTKGEIRNG